MGRFLKLNNDMQTIADKLLENQDLCKLLKYEGENPLSMPEVRPSEIMDKRLLLSSKIFGNKEIGSFLTLEISGGKPKSSEHYIQTSFFFDILIHHDARKIINGQRVNFISDIIEEVMESMTFSIGKVNFYGFERIGNNDGRFLGRRLIYRDVDFRNIG